MEMSILNRLNLWCIIPFCPYVVLWKMIVMKIGNCRFAKGSYY